ncbi:MAG: 3-deoxy-D-manno-octulosonic acid transferase [Acidobacteriota bacterium]
MPLLTRLLYIAYSAGFELATWLVLVPWTLGRSILGSTSRSELGQRLARSRLCSAKAGPRILIHAVSVGEMVAADVLIGALVRVLPTVQVILTSGNRHGWEAGRALQAKHHQVQEVWLLPWDRRGPLTRWLKALRPDLVAVVETELWPNLFLSCRDLRLPLCLVNGRIYPRDVPGYRLARPFFKPALDCVSRFWVQSEAEKVRFCQVGAEPERVSVAGNLKFDAALEPCREPGLTLSRRPVIVAGSTHAPEEGWILDAVYPLRAEFPAILLVIAPRHPRRAPSISSEASRWGLSVTRFSEVAGRPIESDVLILDKMGVLNSFYQMADVAVIGGSLSPCGGHNLLEPAARACSIIMGPHYEHFRDIVDDLQSAGALVLLGDRRELSTALGRLLGDPELRRELGHRARTAVTKRAGVADRYARHLAQLLSPAAAGVQLPG